MKRLVLPLAVLTLLAVAVGLVGKQRIDSLGARPLNLAEPRDYLLPPGASFRRVVADLQRQGVVEEPLLFRLYARPTLRRTPIKAGEYRLEPGLTHDQFLQRITRGEVVQHQLTLVEGQRLSDYLGLMRAEPRLQQTLADLDDAAIAQRLGIAEDNPEGWFYPDTYAYTRGTRDLELLQRAYRRMQRLLDKAWADREAGLPLNTPYEALILASIVEKETAAPEERDEIAGVFVRRLQRGMRLQTDPTVIYGLGEGYQGNITRADLTRKTPYNTYLIRGLPPTPIANPGLEAIEAVLHPAPGNALYFVAKGDGHHQFSATLEEHNRAVLKYQKRGRRKDYRSVPEQKSET